MKKIYFFFFVTLSINGCKEKDEGNTADKNFISILSLVKNEVAHIDTSLYQIVRIDQYDSTRSDTSYIPRDKFREAASDFLDIPDLSDKKVAKRFKSEDPIYATELNRVIISYVPEDPEKEEIKKQEITVTPNTATGDKVTNIIIRRVINNRDSFMEKKMLWMMDRRFQVVTITQKPGQPEKMVTTTVRWKEDSFE